MARMAAENSQRLQSMSSTFRAELEAKFTGMKDEMRRLTIPATPRVTVSTSQEDEMVRNLTRLKEIPKAIAQPGKIGRIAHDQRKRGSGALCPTHAGPNTLTKSKGAFICVSAASIKRPQVTAEAKDMGHLANALLTLGGDTKQKTDETRDELISGCHGLYTLLYVCVCSPPSESCCVVRLPNVLTILYGRRGCTRGGPLHAEGGETRVTDGDVQCRGCLNAVVYFADTRRM